MENTTPLEWSNDAPEFNIPEWKNLRNDKVPAAHMSRHFMILGETGSGKTKSAIIPIMKSIIHNRVNNKRASALIIDPKNELYYEIKDEWDVVFYNQKAELEGKVIDFFEGQRNEKFTADEVQSGFAELFPPSTHDSQKFWVNQQEITFNAFLDIDFFINSRVGLEGLIQFWLEFTAYADNKKTLSQNVDAENKSDKSGTEPQFIYALSEICEKCHWNRENYFLRFLTLANNPHALFYFLNYWAETYPACKLRPSYQQLRQFSSMALKGVEGQFSGILGQLNTLLIKLVNPDLLRYINFNPFQGPVNALFVREMMDNGTWLVFSPKQDSDISDLVARCIKIKYFKFTFERDDKERPFAYICDEFQRFITNDRRSGEQSYLDRCRSFRAICVLATQSLASLSYTMLVSRQGKDLADSSLKILLNNTGNKFFFRNTDTDTIDRLRQLIPQAYTSKRPHVISVRPPSTLKAGECYYLLSDSRWGRAKVEI